MSVLVFIEICNIFVYSVICKYNSSSITHEASTFSHNPPDNPQEIVEDSQIVDESETFNNDDHNVIAPSIHSRNHHRNFLRLQKQQQKLHLSDLIHSIQYDSMIPQSISFHTNIQENDILEDEDLAISSEQDTFTEKEDIIQEYDAKMKSHTNEGKSKGFLLTRRYWMHTNINVLKLKFAINERVV